MINAKTTYDNEIKLTSTNHAKAVRVYCSKANGVWVFQNQNQSRNRFNTYHEGLEFLTKKGW